MVYFLVVLSRNKNYSAIEKRGGMLNDDDHNSSWHMKCAQRTAPNPKFEKMGLFKRPWWHLEKYKGHCGT